MSIAAVSVSRFETVRAPAFCPVFPPDRNTDETLRWLRSDPFIDRATDSPEYASSQLTRIDWEEYLYRAILFELGVEVVLVVLYLGTVAVLLDRLDYPRVGSDLLVAAINHVRIGRTISDEVLIRVGTSRFSVVVLLRISCDDGGTQLTRVEILRTAAQTWF